MPANRQMNRGSIESDRAESNTSLESRLMIVVPIVVGATIILSAWRMLLGVAVISGVGWAWKSYLQKQQQRQAHLNSVFYRLIQENEGRLTALDFAMQAGVEGKEAQEYLDKQAQEFAAGYEITDNGGMVYCFSTIQMPQSYQTLEVESAPVLAESETLAPPPTPNTPSVTLPPPLNQSQLAARLGVHPTTVSKNKKKADFLDWSCQKDPEGLGWTYAPGTKKFFAIAPGEGD
ncbi:hypothetical protein [Phormidium sp. CCY1219]|jgi:hypothetical protein|uniref:hypothetical protein n=1 Tax=Phormidium sp. CCY1219 TaxID=2886104 RepID=UPI002D1F72D4|nr:hypothetical protein [Phormidium sp. CCY1219]MEB3831903.1 hypothetical protein [Phormidium sp. CCY1219]